MSQILLIHLQLEHGIVLHSILYFSILEFERQIDMDTVDVELWDCSGDRKYQTYHINLNFV